MCAKRLVFTIVSYSAIFLGLFRKTSLTRLDPHSGHPVVSGSGKLAVCQTIFSGSGTAQSWTSQPKRRELVP